MRLSRKGIENIRRGLKRSWRDGTHRQLFQKREADADTLRKRALHDRRGSLYAHLRVPSELGFREIELRWSTNGRTDQLDIVEDGRILHTCRPALVFNRILQ